MMLQAIMGTPLLSWLASLVDPQAALGDSFWSATSGFCRMAKACFPEDAELLCARLEETCRPAARVFIHRG